ncbi:hypothetical protein DVH05_011246 [Phytophthora capsici]|nr:hypothetical protein DVH05_011246 [Phytophthora capsici]
MQFAGGTEPLRLTGRKRVLRQLAMTDFLQPLRPTALVRQEATATALEYWRSFRHQSLAEAIEDRKTMQFAGGTEPLRLTGRKRVLRQLAMTDFLQPLRPTALVRQEATATALELAVAPPPAESSSVVEVLPPTSFPAPLAEVMPQPAGEAVISSPKAAGTGAIYDFIQICTWPSSVVKLQWNIFDVSLLVDNDGEELEMCDCGEACATLCPHFLNYTLCDEFNCCSWGDCGNKFISNYELEIFAASTGAGVCCMKQIPK